MQPGAPGGPPQGYGGQPPMGQPPMGYPPQGGMPMGAPAAPNPVQTPAIIMFVAALLILVGTVTHGWMSASADKGDDGVSIGVGLWGMKVEAEGMGVSFSWGEINDQAEARAAEEARFRAEYPEYADDKDRKETKTVGIHIRLLGMLGFLGGIAAAGVAAAVGGLAMSRNLRKVKMPVFLGILAGAAAVHVLFLISIMTGDLGSVFAKGDHKVPFGISYSGFVSIIGLVGAVVVLKQMLGPHIAQAIASGPPMPATPMGAMPMGMAQPPMQAAPPAPAAQVTCPRCGGQATFVAQYNRHFCNACQQYV